MFDFYPGLPQYYYTYKCTIYVGLSQARPNNILLCMDHYHIICHDCCVHTLCTVVFEKLNYGKKRK